jgi:hypothetical protein
VNFTCREAGFAAFCRSISACCSGVNCMLLLDFEGSDRDDIDAVEILVHAEQKSPTGIISDPCIVPAAVFDVLARFKRRLEFRGRHIMLGEFQSSRRSSGRIALRCSFPTNDSISVSVNEIVNYGLK